MLFDIYSSTRTDLDAAGLTDEEKEQFLRMQFKAQTTHYFSHYPKASYQLVLVEDVPVGRLYVDRTDKLFKILDIAILPDYRLQGLGRVLMEDVLAEAREKQCAVRLHVDADKPNVEQWYRRLGFVELDRTPVHIHMEWRCPDADATSAQ